MSTHNEKTSLLSIKELSVVFNTDQGSVNAVNDVSIELAPGEILGVVGESGSGKSAVMYAVMGLLASNGNVVSGEIHFDGAPIHEASFSNSKSYESRMEKIRGHDISMIFQDPMTFLNPVMSIGKQLLEPILNHTNLTKIEARERAVDLLNKVGISSPEKRLKQYPHEFSGGMRQRIIIAIALANAPRLIIADEPTTALDVTIQAQILELISILTKQNNSSAIIITHDLGVVASMCDRVVILYGGRVMETGTDREIYYNPAHPYTKGLLNCINNPEESEKELRPIPGSPPDLLSQTSGCPFVNRCEEAMRICKIQMPKIEELSETHTAACWVFEAARKRWEAMKS